MNTMIIAEVKTDTMEARFSLPDESFAKASFTPIMSIREVERQVAFKNRKYIIEKMTSWLRQRRVANPAAELEIVKLLTWMEDIRFRGLYHICELITRKRRTFQYIAPAESSTCYSYYSSTIIPILEFCTGESIKANS